MGESEAPAALRRQFLEWVAERDRTHREVMAVWRTSCPRFPIWEDAVRDGLVAFEDRTGTTMIVLSDKGRAAVLD